MTRGTRAAPPRYPDSGYQPEPPEPKEMEPESCRKFKCRDLIEHTDGRGSLGKIGQLTALVVSSVCFIWMVWSDTMTEFYFVGYMLAWSGANVANKLADRNPRRDRGRYQYRDTDRDGDYR